LKIPHEFGRLPGGPHSMDRFFARHLPLPVK